MFEELYGSIPDVNAYLNRIGASLPPKANLDTLNQLIYLHQSAVPFENLEVYLEHKPISLAITDIYEKVVLRRRGGYCFELNALFQALLSELGYQTAACGCRILRGKDYIPPLLHRGILVTIEEKTYYSDVGYGGPVPGGAIALSETTQTTCFGITYGMKKKDPNTWILYALSKDGKPENMIQFLAQPQIPVDFIAPNFYCCHNQDFIFYQIPYVSLRIPGGTRTLIRNVYTETRNDHIETLEVNDVTSMKQILAEKFNLALV